MTCIILALPTISALLFLVSAGFWLRAATFRHPKNIDLGGIDDDDDEEPKDWFWAYKRVSRLNAWAAGFAAAGALVTAAGELSKFFG